MDKEKSKTLKYQSLIEKMKLSESCPYKECVEQNILGFRFTYSDINHEDNFLPVILFDEKNNRPPRVNSSEDFKCSCCALSMFNTIEAAKSKFDGFLERTKKLFAYTHIAAGAIKKETGKVSEVNYYGHFDLFEYEDAVLSNSFQIVGKLRDGTN